MAFVLQQTELKWPRRYWVQPGEIAVLKDGGNTTDADGTPNIYREGDQIRARFRFFPADRKQELLVFDGKRQAKPVTLENEEFTVSADGTVVSLSADIYYRLGNPLGMLREVRFDDEEQVAQYIRSRVRHLVEMFIQRRPLVFSLGMHNAVRELLLNNLWLAENDLVIEDVVVYHLVPPLRLQEARGTLVVQLERYRDRVIRLLHQGIDPTFAYMQEHERALAQRILARANEQYRWLLQRPGTGDSSRELVLLVEDAWNSMVRSVRNELNGVPPDDEDNQAPSASPPSTPSPAPAAPSPAPPAPSPAPPATPPPDGQSA